MNVLMRSKMRNCRVFRGVRARSIAIATAITVCLILGMPVAANAGSVSGTTIAFTVTSTQVMFIYVNTALSLSPGCHTSAAGNRFVIPLGTPSSSAQIAAILSAQAGGRIIDINGNGACNVWADTETMNDITVH
jgi:hypothetical protein